MGAARAPLRSSETLRSGLAGGLGWGIMSLTCNVQHTNSIKKVAISQEFTCFNVAMLHFYLILLLYFFLT